MSLNIAGRLSGDRCTLVLVTEKKVFEEEGKGK